MSTSRSFRLALHSGALLGVMALAGCGGGAKDAPTAPPAMQPPPLPPAPGPISVGSITIDFPTASLALGQSLVLTPVLRDASGNVLTGRTLAWTSSDGSVGRVDANGSTGNVTALKAGVVVITGRIDGVSVSSTVTVVAFSAVNAGPAFSCAITESGKLYCAGGPYSPLAVPVAPSMRFTAVAIGGQPAPLETFACAIAVDRGAYCWGANGAGQLGVGDQTRRSDPAPVLGGKLFASISTGVAHACGISTSGEALCWGDGAEGRLATGDEMSRSTPTTVRSPGGTTFTQIDAGNFATCGVARSGQAYCWGRNDLGQLGSSGTTHGKLGDFSLLPVAVDSASSTMQIVTRGPKTCFLTSAGKAFCFGDNSVFTLGTPSTQLCYGQKPCSARPLAVQTTQLFTTLAASQFATCGLTAARTTSCWGMDFELLFGGVPGAVPSCPAPGAAYGCTLTPVSGAVGLVTLTAARGNSCGLKADGIAYCWGGNGFGQRGAGGAFPDPTARVFSISPASVP